MKYGFLDYPTPLEMVHHYPFQQLGSDVGIPDALRINHYNRTAAADAEARSFASLDP